MRQPLYLAEVSLLVTVLGPFASVVEVSDKGKILSVS
jgi:hypothetical protein